MNKLQKNLTGAFNMEKISIGSDPEILLYSELENKFKSVAGLIGGTKDMPTPITDKGHFIQEDGVAAEFNIPPCVTPGDFSYHINFVLNYLRDTITGPNNLILSTKASAMFTHEELKSKQANEIGCTPDLNAWKLEYNNPQGYTSNLRAVGGHVHVGYNSPSESTSIEIAKTLDLFLGVPSVLLDDDTDRRSLYGKAGAMRFKPFGMEYRTLSNFWIHDEVLIKWVFTNTIKAIEYLNIGGEVTNPDEVQKAINTCDKSLAQEIISDYNIEMPVLTKKIDDLYVGID